MSITVGLTLLFVVVVAILYAIFNRGSRGSVVVMIELILIFAAGILFGRSTRGAVAERFIHDFIRLFTG